MKNSRLKTDEFVECTQIKSGNHNKLVSTSSKDSNSIVKIDQPSGVYFTTVVKKQHGFHGKHKQIHYQQCLLVVFKRVGVVQLGYIVKSGGIPIIQNLSQIIQNSLPITKCRDIQSISDKEIALFLHQNDSKNQWKFKFCQKEIKQKWMISLMILAQKEYKKSIEEIFTEQMLVNLSSSAVNQKDLTNGKITKLSQDQLGQKIKFLKHKNRQLQTKLNQKLQQRIQMEKICQNLGQKNKEIECLKLILDSQNKQLKQKIMQAGDKLNQNSIAFSKILDYWLVINNEKVLLLEQQRKFAEISNSLNQQFQILIQNCDQNYETMQKNIQENINQLEQKQEKNVKQLGREIRSSKLTLEVFMSQFNRVNPINPEKFTTND